MKTNLKKIKKKIVVAVAAVKKWQLQIIIIIHKIFNLINLLNISKFNKNLAKINILCFIHNLRIYL